MSLSYVCPHCGAHDSTTCAFKATVYGEVWPSQREEARKVGCRVQYYTDKRKEENENS